MPRRPGSLRRDPLSARYDGWARLVLEQLEADPWNWHERTVLSPLGPVDSGGLTHCERAAVRSLYWCLNHAASSGAKIRPEWSLQVAWSAPRSVANPEEGPALMRRRELAARVTPRDAGRRAVLLGLAVPYVRRPTSRGTMAGESWEPKGEPG